MVQIPLRTRQDFQNCIYTYISLFHTEGIHYIYKGKKILDRYVFFHQSHCKCNVYHCRFPLVHEISLDKTSTHYIYVWMNFDTLWTRPMNREQLYEICGKAHCIMMLFQYLFMSNDINKTNELKKSSKLLVMWPVLTSKSSQLSMKW